MVPPDDEQRAQARAQFRATNTAGTTAGIALKLVVRDPDGEVSEVTFERSLIKIGRLSSCHLMLDEAEVSRLHAIIEVPEVAGGPLDGLAHEALGASNETPSDRVTVIDLGSTGGTFVNDQRINKADVQAGDKIRIGGFHIMVAQIGRGD